MGADRGLTIWRWKRSGLNAGPPGYHSQSCADTDAFKTLPFFVKQAWSQRLLSPSTVLWLLKLYASINAKHDSKEPGENRL